MNSHGFLGFDGADWQKMIGLMFVQSIAFLSLTLSPIYLSILVSEFGLTETQAGSLLTVEFFALALTSSAIGTVINRCSWFYLALLGGLLVVVGNGVSSTLPDANETLFLLMRVVSGCGTGLCMAVAVSGVLSISNPDRAFGFVGAGSFSLSATVLAISGFVFEKFGPTSIFMFVVVVVGISILPSVTLRSAKPKNSGEESDSKYRTLPALNLGLLYMVVVMAFGLASNIAWTFGVQLGITSSVSVPDAIYWIGANYYMSMPGNLLAGWLGLRYGRAPFFIALLAVTLSLWLLSGFQLPTTFIVGQLIFGLGYGLGVPYMYGVGAALDDQGRWAAITPGVFMLSVVISPVLGGYLFDVAGGVWITATLLGCMVVAITLLLIVVRLMAKKSKEEEELEPFATQL